MKTFKKYYYKNTLKTVIEEGGGAGHMLHPFDRLDSTFSELKDLISSLMTGGVKFIEKTDGMNALITWKDGDIKLARNKTTIRNPLSIDDTAKKFSGRGEVKLAFINSMQDLKSAFLSAGYKHNELDELFKNGSIFINLEIIYPPTTNMIDYGNKAILQFHNANEYDTASAKVIKKNTTLIKSLYSTIDKKNQLEQKTFTIYGPIKIKLDNIEKLEVLKNDHIKDLNGIMKTGNVSNSSTINEYFINIINTYLDEEFSTIPDIARDMLINRWANNDKSVNIGKIKKEINDVDVNTELSIVDKTIYDKLIKPFEILFLKIGADILLNVSNFLAVNPNDTIKKISKDIEKVVNAIDNNEVSDEKIDKVKNLLNTLDSIGRDKISPLEGVVFIHKGETYKLTGTFAPINRLIGLVTK